MKDLNAEAGISLEELTTVAAEAVRSGITDVLGDGLTEKARTNFRNWPTVSRGWYAEGQANGLVLRDHSNENEQIEELLALVGKEYRLLVCGGIGMGLAVTKTSSRPFDEILPSPDRDLIYDGYGFYMIMFESELTLRHQYIPEAVVSDPDKLAAYNQGIGRGLWFTQGNNISEMANKVAQFPLKRQPAMWTGLAFGATYAGGSAEVQKQLLKKGERFLANIKLGCAYACYIRAMSNAQAEHSDRAAQSFTGMPAETLAAIVDEALPDSDDATERWTEVAAKVIDAIAGCEALSA